MGRRAPAVFVFCLVLLAAAGCGLGSTSSSGMTYPAGASLEQFGLRDRCPPEADCSERAMEVIEGALARLGPEIMDTPITTNGGAAGPPADRLYIDVTSDPMLAWRSSSGPEGASAGFMIDLTDENPYVVVAPRFAFRLSDADAAAIRDALFVAR
jgi:hypothetical protein